MYFCHTPVLCAPWNVAPIIVQIPHKAAETKRLVSVRYLYQSSRSNVALACALEEEAHDKDLQCAHAYNQAGLDEAKVDNPLLGTSNSAEIAVLTRPKILLVAGDGGKLAGDSICGLAQGIGLLIGAALFRWESNTGFIFDLWLAPRG